MAASSSHMWYVKAAGGVWGPYPEGRVAGFIAEGRVTATTPLSPWNSGPFTPAAVNAEFAPLLSAERAPTAPAPPPGPAPRAAPTRPAPVAVPVERLQAERPSRALLVWGEISAERIGGFHSALGGIGPGVTIRPGLWLLQAPASAAAVRNHLSRHLGPADRLLVVEAPIERAAWFNLTQDKTIRALWNQTPAERSLSSA